jgi:hypothetical protein
MSRHPRSHPSPRARPVAEAPVGAPLERADELARRWAIALIQARPLEQIAELHLQTLAREAPALCAQVIRALESDAELERLEGGGATAGRGQSAPALDLAALTGARNSAVEAVEAVEALRGALWEALLAELRDPPARQVADLGDRLAYVCAMALAAALAAAQADQTGVEAHQQQAGDDGSWGAAGDRQGPPIGPRGAIIVDEHRQSEAEPEERLYAEPRSALAEPTQERPSAAQSQERPAAQSQERPAAQRKARPLPWDDLTGPAAGEAGAAPAEEAPEIEVKDERGEEGPAAWISSIGRQLERYERDHLPFAVLLVELGDAERLRRAALPGALASLTSRIERLLTEELQRSGGHLAQRRGGPAGSLTCERPGRYWMVAPATDAIAAGRLADWVVRTMGPLAGPRWAPIEVTVGIAVCPDDGREAAALAAHADLGLYAPPASSR